MLLQTWVNISYTMYQDMRGHTGIISSICQGIAIHNCSKQKIETKSSTESELVGVSDYLPCTVEPKIKRCVVASNTIEEKQTKPDAQHMRLSHNSDIVASSRDQVHTAGTTNVTSLVRRCMYIGPEVRTK